MSKILYQLHNGISIPIGDISAKKTHNINNRNEVVTVFKVFHSGPGSEEDIFVFYYNKLLEDWMLDLDKSLISLNMRSNYRLLDEVYCNFQKSKPINVQEFSELLCEKHIEIFAKANCQAPTNIKPLFKRIREWLFFWRK